jgi:hypothetical protein
LEVEERKCIWYMRRREGGGNNGEELGNNRLEAGQRCKSTQLN